MDNDRLRPDVLVCIKIFEYQKMHNLEHPAKIFVSSAAFVELVKTEGSGLTAFANGSYMISSVIILHALPIP